jgi:hypothetical protein
MKNLYNISKWQLIVAWIFGVLLAYVVLDCGYNTVCGSIENSISLLILFTLAFYTVGWWQRNKSKLG